MTPSVHLKTKTKIECLKDPLYDIGRFQSDGPNSITSVLVLNVFLFWLLVCVALEVPY